MEFHAKTITQEQRRSMLARIEKEAVGISTGAGASNKAFVFFDPECSYCGDLWRETQLIEEQVDFVWVPVGTLGEDSMLLGASILGAANPAGMMATAMGALKTSGKPMPLESAPPDAALATVRANTELMASVDPTAPIQATPLMYYRSANGHIELISGSMDAHALKSALKLK